MKQFIFFVFCVVCTMPLSAQNSFIQFQKKNKRVYEASKNKEELLIKEFSDKGLEWPAKYIYIRSFKYDGELEVWVKQNVEDKYRLFKTYKVCLQSGTVGPKRQEGDFQVPEGFYYITRFNPQSNYHLSLELNYPNPSDRVLSDRSNPGNDIFIHGSCVSVGCIPVTDSDIEEIYILAAYARDAGQEYIPVNIFPIRYNKKKSVEYLENFFRDEPDLIHFSDQLEEAYNYFEKNHRPPVILIDSDGKYVVGN